MSNTSLKPITIPKLNSADFGKAISEAFENIDLNFKKLANLDVNKGASGRSCLYVPIHLGAAFLYNPCDINNVELVDCYNAFIYWESKFPTLEKEHGDLWTKFVKDVDDAYNQYHEVTGKSRMEYAQLASILLWGNPSPFGFGATPAEGSLTRTLHDYYEGLDGEVTINWPGQEPSKLYGDWLYRLSQYDPRNRYEIDKKTNAVYNSEIDKYYNLFSVHFGIVGVGKIVMALSPDPVYNSYHPVGSFEYWYVDPRYRCGVKPSGTEAAGDISCVLRWVTDTYGTGSDVAWDGHFEILEIFPTIRIGDDGQYYWHINGSNTGIPVQGNPGKDGKSAQMLVVERVENVRGWDRENPNGANFWSPVSGPNLFRMLNYSGVPSRVKDWTYKSQLQDNVPMQKVAGTSQVDSTLRGQYVLANDYTGRVSQFKYTEQKGWLSEKADEQIKNIAEIGYLFRIYRVVGRERFYDYDIEPLKDVMAIDEYDRVGDPSCDMFYFGKDDVSHVSKKQDIQNLIKDLDGTLAIVLPGPAYKHDRTDTAFWFATLRAVRTDEDGVFELVAYCSPHAQQTTQLDEHSQAGMMQSFDAYTHKSTSDNRNKPRGLMLPIGSSMAASGTPSDTWAAHIIHSDTGGFTGMVGSSDGRRGIQNVKVTDEDDKVFTGGVGRLSNNLDENVGKYNGQYTEVINKRILHVGSVNDYRALNYVEDCAEGDDALNGAVPGRKATGDEGVLIGTANFFGKTNNQGWFVGTELHVDEPVTITRYRDLKPKGRLLDVEGDVVIGPHTHKNIPNIKYRYRSGGLVVASTLTIETLADTALINNEDLIFPVGLLSGGTQLRFEPFIKSVDDLSWGAEIKDGSIYHNTRNTRAGVWKTRLARFRGERGLRSNSAGVLKGTSTPILGSTQNDNPLFSGVFDDTIGARMMIVTDGFGIYNPMNIDEDGNAVNVPFSVDTFGNIQTYGREIRSNSDNTAWFLHTKWSETIATETDEELSFGGETKFALPRHNSLNVTSFHKISAESLDAEYFKTKYWRTSNLTDDIGYAGASDPTIAPYGYYHVFGFTDSNGKPATTFPHNNPTGFANTFGGSDYLPTVLSIPADLQINQGGFIGAGINPRAIIRSFDETTYRIRFGGAFKYGLVISEPAKINIGRENLAAANLDGNMFVGNNGLNLTSTYDGRKRLENQGDDTTGATAGLFNGLVSSTIGLWNMHGAIVEKAMIVGGDILGHQSLSVRGQARAKSFRRHIPSAYFEDNLKFRDDGLIRDQEKAFAFLLDNGWSSTPAPQISDPKTLFDAHLRSPLVLDLGEAYGSSRLIKFGQIGTIDLDAETFDLNIDNENMRDYSTALFGWNPTASMYKYGVRCDSLFKNFKPGGRVVNGFEVNALCNALWAQVSITIDLNAKSLSRDKYTNNSIKFIGTNETHTTAFGIVLPNTVGSYRTDNIGHNHYYNAYEVKNDPTGPEIEFDGFNWKEIFTWTKKELKNGKWESVEDTSHLPFPKPMYNVDVFVGAAFHGSTNCNWYPTGTNSSRDRQFGALFRLTPNGKFTMPYYMHPEALTTEAGQTITISFTYPVAPATMLTRYVTAESATYTSDKTSITGPFEHLEDSPLADKNPNNTWKCFWYKKYSGFDSRYKEYSDSLWKDIEWTLWKSYSKIDTEYYSSARYTEVDGEVVPANKDKQALTINDIGTDLKKNLISVTYDQQEIDQNNPEAYYLTFVNKDHRCLWAYTTTTDCMGSSSSWELIYEYNPSAAKGGFFAQSTKVGFLGLTLRNGKTNNTECQKSDYFAGTTDVYTIPSGIFKRFGYFGEDDNFNFIETDDEGYVTKFMVKTTTPIVNAFSVNYWESGSMSYLKLIVMLDCADGPNGKTSDRSRSWVYGLAGSSSEPVYNANTNAWLPAGAKLPSTPVDVYFGGLSHCRWTTKEQDFTGGLQLRLGTDGHVTMPYAHRTWQLMQRPVANKNVNKSDVPLYMEFLFIYKSSDRVLETNYYDDECGDSGQMANDDGSKGTYENPDTPNPTPPTTSVVNDWTWTDNSDPTSGSLDTWLKDDKRGDLLNQLKDEMVENEMIDISSPFGTASIKCLQSTTFNADDSIDNAGKKLVSLWVTANSEEGSPSTHRSITFTWDNGTISDVHSVLLKKNFNPGYYASDGAENENTTTPTPTSDVTYIGTTNNGSTKPWIWYTNDGKTWTVISRPVVTELGYTYVLSTGISMWRDANRIAHYTPSGILATFKADKTVNVYNGSDNFIPTNSDQNIEGWLTPGGTNHVMTNMKGEPEIFDKVRGYTNLWKIKTDNFTPDGRKNALNWIRINEQGIFESESWGQLSKTFIDPVSAIPLHTTAYWMKDSNTNNFEMPFEAPEVGDNRAVSIRFDDLRNGPTNPSKYANRIKNWFAIALNYFLINYNSDPKHPTWESRKYALFTEDTGWGSQWDSLSIFQEHNGVLYVNLANETHIEAPSRPFEGGEPGGSKVPILRCEWHMDVQNYLSSIKGCAEVKYGGFDRTNIDAPTGYNYLCAEYAMQNQKTSDWDKDRVRKMSIPVILGFRADLIHQMNGKIYRVFIEDKCDNTTPVVFTVTEITGSDESATVGDLETRVQVLESNSHTKPSNATTTSDGLMSKEDKSKLDNLSFIETTIQSTNPLHLDNATMLDWFDSYELNDSKTLKRMANRILRSSMGETQVLLYRFHGRVDNVLMDVNGRTDVACDCFMYSTGIMHTLKTDQQTIGEGIREQWLVIWRERGTNNVGLTSIMPNINLGGGGEGSYDDTDLRNKVTNLENEVNNLKGTITTLETRLAALEDMVTMIQASPLSINLTMPANDTMVQLNLTGTDVNGNDVDFDVENNSDSDITVS